MRCQHGPEKVAQRPAYPDQQRQYFTLRDAQMTLSHMAPKAGAEGAIYAGLETLTKQLLGVTWQRDDGAQLRIDRCLIDANWGASTETVYKFCQQSSFGAALMPSHGRYVGAASVPFAEYRQQQGDRNGHNWRIPSTVGKRSIKHVVYDTNFWKTFVFARLAVAMGDRGCLSLFGERPEDHRLISEHLTAEYPVTTIGRGRTVEEWKHRPDRPDNHWFDCLVGAAVAASMQGAHLESERPPQKVRKRMTLAEMQAGRPTARELAASPRASENR
jgi:phage terminase large subunit GpA-like protein